ncbi:P-type H+-ATPase, putative, partial [Bodo saltans]
MPSCQASAQDSREPTHHEPTTGQNNEDDHEPVLPAKKTSSFFRRQVDPGNDEGAATPQKSRSTLQRLGIDPIMAAPDPVLDRPPRSPTGAIRSHSGIKFRPKMEEGNKTLEGKVDDSTEVPMEKPWHLYEPEDLYHELGIKGTTGLTSDEVQERLLQYGKNLITPPPTTHWLVKILMLLCGGFQVMMIGGGILCFIVYAIS